MSEKVEKIDEDNVLSPVVVTKYQVAADIVNKALASILNKVDITVLELCALGDSSITELSKTVYNKGKVPKGIAFPTCVSVGTALCHLSPLPSDPEASIVLKKGDLVRIEMGAHVDGYVSQLAHTYVIGATKEAPVTGKMADVIQAAYEATEVAIRMIKPGNTNYQVTDMIQKTLESFGCKGVEGMLTHQVLRNEFDGPKTIVLNPTENQRREIAKATFEAGEVYGLDILVSSGEGKTRPMDTRTTVYKRDPEVTYSLKMKSSRAVFSQITKDCGSMGFTLRSLEDEAKARLGIVECANHGLVVPYAVMHEAPDAVVAHFMYTILLMPNGPLKVSSFPFDQEVIKSDKKVTDPEVIAVLAQPIRSKKTKNVAAEEVKGQ